MLDFLFALSVTVAAGASLYVFGALMAAVVNARSTDESDAHAARVLRGCQAAARAKQRLADTSLSTS